MSGSGNQSSPLALPILLTGLLGGLLGGFSCCCWLAPGGTAFLAVRWARNLEPSGRGTVRAGLLSTWISACVVGTFGTAVWLKLNDPASMDAADRAMLDALGGGGLSDVSLGTLAFTVALSGFLGASLAGLVGTLLAGIGGSRSVRPSGAPRTTSGGGSGAAARFLKMPPVPRAQPESNVERLPGTAEGLAEELTLREPTEVPGPSSEPAEPVSPEPSAERPPDEAVDPLSNGSGGEATEPDWGRYRRPESSGLEVSSEELPSVGEEAGAWEDTEDGED